MPMDLAQAGRPRTPANKKKRVNYNSLAADYDAQIGRDVTADTAAFRGRRSARDRTRGLNVGRTSGGERLHPMMPGVPMNTPYRPTAYEAYEPNTEARQQKLLGLGNVLRFADAAGIPPSSASALTRDTTSYSPAGQLASGFLGGGLGGFSAGALGGMAGGPLLGATRAFVGGGVAGGGGAPRPSASSTLPTPADPPLLTDNTSANRIAAMKRLAGDTGLSPIAAAGRAGLTNYYADSPAGRQLSDADRAAGQQRRQAYDLRVAGRKERAGQLAEQRGLERAARLAQRQAGPSMDDRLAMMAAQGNVGAQRALALSNQRFGDQLRAQTDVEVARQQNQPRTPEEMRTALAVTGMETGLPPDQLGGYQDFISGNAPAQGAGLSPSDIAANPDIADLQGEVSRTEAGELSNISKNGDPSAIVSYGRAKGWDDAKINRIMNKLLGSRWRSVDNPGGWSNWFTGRAPDATGAVGSWYTNPGVRSATGF